MGRSREKRPAYPSDHRRWFRVLEDILDSPKLDDDLPADVFRFFIRLLAMLNRAKSRDGEITLSRRALNLCAGREQHRHALAIARRGADAGLYSLAVDGDRALIRVPNWPKHQGFTPEELRSGYVEGPAPTPTPTPTPGGDAPSPAQNGRPPDDIASAPAAAREGDDSHKRRAILRRMLGAHGQRATPDRLEGLMAGTSFIPSELLARACNRAQIDAASERGFPPSSGAIIEAAVAISKENGLHDARRGRPDWVRRARSEPERPRPAVAVHPTASTPDDRVEAR